MRLSFRPLLIIPLTLIVAAPFAWIFPDFRPAFGKLLDSSLTIAATAYRIGGKKESEEET